MHVTLTFQIKMENRFRCSLYIVACAVMAAYGKEILIDVEHDPSPLSVATEQTSMAGKNLSLSLVTILWATYTTWG